LRSAPSVSRWRVSTALAFESGHPRLTDREGAAALGAYTNAQLELLRRFLRGNVAYQEERMRRLEALKVEEPN
jgi:hypothetical protein